MIGTTEQAETQNLHRVIDLTTRAHEKERDLPDEIRIKGDQIGTGFWTSMLGMTAQDGLEKGLTVSKYFGRIFTSEIAQGQVIDGIPKVEYPALPILNNGISLVHSHPPLEKVNPNAPTTTMSNGDCLEFFKYKAFPCSVMIDEGGVHLLLREKPLVPTRFNNFPKDIADQAIIESNGLTLDALKRLADKLERFGIRYYFSPSKEVLPNGTVLFKDIRRYPDLAPPKIV